MKEEKIIKLLKKLANRALKIGEVPVSAIITKDEKIIAMSYNTMERDKSSLSHAEIKCIKKAQKKLNTWRLDSCKIYVSLEPCLMCSGAIHFSRIKDVIFLLKSNDYSISDLPLNIKIKNLDDEEYKMVLKNFFVNIRLKNKNRDIS